MPCRSVWWGRQYLISICVDAALVVSPAAVMMVVVLQSLRNSSSQNPNSGALSLEPVGWTVFSPLPKSCLPQKCSILLKSAQDISIVLKSAQEYQAVLSSDKGRCIYPGLGGLGAPPPWEQLQFFATVYIKFCLQKLSLNFALHGRMYLRKLLDSGHDLVCLAITAKMESVRFCKTFQFLWIPCEIMKLIKLNTSLTNLWYMRS